MSSNYPPLLILNSESDYRTHFETLYCQGPIITFDGIPVRFRKGIFNHAFYESTRGRKDNLFSRKRAERLEWIKAALQDPKSERYYGWDSKKKTYNNKRRVTIVQENYVVVIAIKKNGGADFITAFVADTPPRPGRPSTIQQIRNGPKWA